jgi:hypothetical protein
VGEYFQSRLQALISLAPGVDDVDFAALFAQLDEPAE